MKYTIKEISDLLGVTTHKLRYYEKIGIIQPEVNEQTGYRYFSVIDTRRFNLARLYRGMGFSVEECLSLLGNMKSIDIIEAIDNRRNELKKEVLFKMLCVDDMEHYTSFLKSIPELIDSVSIIELERHIRLEFSDNEKIVRDKKTLRLRDELLEYTPLIRWVSRIPKETLEKRSGDLHYHYGINMRFKNAVELGLNVDNYQEVEAGKYLITVFKKNNNPNFGWETLTLIQDYLKKYNITEFGDGFSSCIHSTAMDEVYSNYHYLIVKIN